MKAHVVYWHRDLPPLDAEAMAEHVVEATSARVPDTIAHRDELWDRCYADLMAQANVRLEQEAARLGGQCVRVLDEAIDTRHDGATGEAWLHGPFTYMLYRRPSAAGESQTSR
jgi:hypothetical protein